MRQYVRDQVFSTVLVIWATVTLAFVALQLIPGNALVNELLQGGASPAEIEAQLAEQGLATAPLQQYITYWMNLLQGDLGTSTITRLPVSRIIGEQLPATLILGASAFLIALVGGLLLGFVAALYPTQMPGKIASLVSVFALSVPIFWTSTLAIYLFSTQLSLLPATGSGSVVHLILPAGILGFHVAGSVARIAQTSLEQTIAAEFVRTAQAKGLRQRRILFGHILRASLPPIVSVLALQAGFLLGGTVIIEMIFARQGIGQLLHKAVLTQDYPVVLGIVALSAIIYSLLNALADVLNGFFDPRMRSEETL